MSGARLQLPGTLLWLVFAMPSAQAEDQAATITTALPGTAITQSMPSVIDGLYEVVAGDNLLYVDASGRYLVIGSIYDLHQDKDLSAERRAELADASHAAAVASPLLDRLPLDVAVTTGTGGRSLTVIMDPACGWCRRLWAESLRDLDNVRVRHLLPNVSEQGIGILCAKAPGEALARALEVSATTAKTPVPDAACRREAHETLDQVAQFIEQAGLFGTPVLIREDGAVHRGYLGRTALLRWLDGSGNDD